MCEPNEHTKFRFLLIMSLIYIKARINLTLVNAKWKTLTVGTWNNLLNLLNTNKSDIYTEI